MSGKALDILINSAAIAHVVLSKTSHGSSFRLRYR